MTHFTISRHSLIFGLSYALDIAGKNNLSHSKSTAYLSVLIGREIGMSESDILDLYYAALLHDIGISDEHVIKEYKADMKRHCVIGVEMLEKLPLPKSILDNVLYHHEYNDGSGPFHLTWKDIPKASQVICAASDFDDAFGKTPLYNRELYLKVCEWLEKRRSLFSEEVANAFSDLADREHFLLDYFNYETKYALSERAVVPDDVFYETDDIIKFALCFADVIDRRSSFTFSHSTGIAGLAKKAAAYLGYDSKTQCMMYIAGLLHDIGKLHVPPGILHKNGPLTPAERFEINKHTYYTRKILEQVKGFEDIVDIAANHHERLDGAGYPFRIPGDRLTDLEKIMAVCDVYQALTEKRPYRDQLSSEKVWGIIDGMAEDMHLDKRLADELKNVFD